MKQIHPLGFTTSAILVAYLLSNDLSISEQAAIGSWFNVIGDVLAASSAWGSVIQERCESLNDNSDNEKELLKKSIEKIQKILDDNNIMNKEVDDDE